MYCCIPGLKIMASFHFHTSCESTAYMIFWWRLESASYRNQNVSGLIPGQGTYLDWEFNPRCGCTREATSYFSHIDISLSLLLSLKTMRKCSWVKLRKLKKRIRLYATFLVFINQLELFSIINYPFSHLSNYALMVL